MIDTIKVLRETERAMQNVRNNIYAHSLSVDLEKFMGIFYTEIFVREATKELEKEVARIEAYVGDLDEIDQKVVYRRDVEHKALKMIADELGYSYDHIRRVSARNKRTCHIYATHKTKKPC